MVWIDHGNDILSDFHFEDTQDVGIYESAPSMPLQLFLYFNVFIFPIWLLNSGLFLYLKCLGDLTKFLSVGVLLMSSVIECLRLYLGYVGNLAEQIPELAGFWMLSVLLQFPLLTFLLTNPYLNSCPIELTLHGVMWFLLISQLGIGFAALKSASSRAKEYYAIKSKMKPENNLKIVIEEKKEKSD